MSNPLVQGADLALKLGAIGAPPSQAEVTRALWQQQLDVAEATERVHDRQIRLLLAQRDVIDSQLAEATRKRDDATRTVLTAQQALAEAEQ